MRFIFTPRSEALRMAFWLVRSLQAASFFTLRRQRESNAETRSDAGSFIVHCQTNCRSNANAQGKTHGQSYGIRFFF